MANPDAEHRLARLLAGRDEPSVLETEALFDRIAGAAEAPPWWRRRATWAGFGALAATAAALVLVPRGDEFGARGGDAAVLRPHCVIDDAKAPCARGAKLLFDARPPDDKPYFAAFARRPDGKVVWYLPAPDEKSAALPDRTAVVPTAARLGDEHPAGEYTLYGVFTPNAASRAELQATVGAALESTDDATVVARVFEVQ